MGRSYIDRNEKTEKKQTKVNETNNGMDDIEVIEEETEEVESLQSWTKNKMRGFKRINPSSAPAPRKPAPPTKHSPLAKPAPDKPRTTTPPTGNPSCPPKPSPSPPDPITESLSVNEDNTGTPLRTRYCHFFVNTGFCEYGNICRYKHEIAPMCRAGINCSRLRCMYSHPRISGNNNHNFLGKGMPLYPNPWITQQPQNQSQQKQQNQFQQQPQNQFHHQAQEQYQQMPNHWNGNHY